jgi:hypothetical protein
MRARASGIVLLVLAVAACNGPTLGYCDIFYDEPLLNVINVRDRVTNAALPQVMIRNVNYNGRVVADLHPLVDGSPAPGITIVGQELRCDVACGFSVDEGPYQFTVHRVGYRDTTVTTNAVYATRRGSCPTTLSGGVKLHLVLSPE